MKRNLELGQKVKDVITGFTGIVMVRCEYLTGCTQYGVAPQVGKDRKAPDWSFFDVDRLKVVCKTPVRIGDDLDTQPVESHKRKGGPQPTPSRY